MNPPGENSQHFQQMQFGLHRAASEFWTNAVLKHQPHLAVQMEHQHRERQMAQEYAANKKNEGLLQNAYAEQVKKHRAAHFDRINPGPGQTSEAPPESDPPTQQVRRKRPQPPVANQPVEKETASAP